MAPEKGSVGNPTGKGGFRPGFSANPGGRPAFKPVTDRLRELLEMTDIDSLDETSMPLAARIALKMAQEALTGGQNGLGNREQLLRYVEGPPIQRVESTVHNTGQLQIVRLPSNNRELESESHVNSEYPLE